MKRLVSWPIILVFLLIGCTTDSVPEDRFVRFFDELAFGGGSDGAGTKTETLRRWRGPFHWSFTGSDAFGDIFAQNVERLAKLAGVKAKQISGEAPIKVLQESKPDGYPVNRDITDCYIRLEFAGDEIVSGTIRIASAEQDRIQRCAAHEILHAFGFRFHSGAIASALSPFHGSSTATKWDAMAIRLLMSDDLRSGLSRNSVLAHVRRVLPEIQQWAGTLRTEDLRPTK